MRRMVLSLFLLLCTAFSSFSQTYNERVQSYISQYRGWAIAEQRRSGVPAAITLAQGVLETAAGNSELCTLANNHFGIKCRKEWAGETFNHDDDKPNECFRKYSLALDSYKDHSDYLRSGTRYQSCFLLEPTNYAAWAAELRKCGYATNPRYAQQLIKIIEDFNLQQFTLVAMSDAPVPVNVAGEVVPNVEAPRAAAVVGRMAPAAQPAAQAAAQEFRAVAAPVVAVAAEMQAEAQPIEDDAVQYGTVLHKNNLKGFYARKGDVLLESAMRFDIRYARLLELNDLPDAPLEADMFIYLEKKAGKGQRVSHVVKPGESLLQIAQAEGMQLRQLRHLNQLENNEEARPGATLQLRQYAASKPAATIALAPRPASAAAPVVAAVTPKPAAVPTQRKPAFPAPADVDADNEETTPAPAPVPTRTVSRPATTPPAAPAPVQKPVNIADEVAVEEAQPAPAPVVVSTPAPQTAPAPAETVSDFSRLKSNLDRMIYNAPASTTPAPAPRPVVAAAPAPVVAPAAAHGAQYHTVQPKETMYGIATKYGMKPKQLMQLNGMKDYEAIHAGQRLRVK